MTERSGKSAPQGALFVFTELPNHNAIPLFLEVETP
jgi:hypothetical protein